MLCIKNLLSYILLLPLLGAFSLLPISSSNSSLLRQVALSFSCLTFVLSLIVWVLFNKSIGTFQLVNKFFWIPILNLNFALGVDGISLFFLFLVPVLGTEVKGSKRWLNLFFLPRFQPIEMVKPFIIIFIAGALRFLRAA